MTLSLHRVSATLLIAISLYLIAGCGLSTVPPTDVQPPADLTQLSATEAAALLKSGTIKSEALVSAYLAKIKTRGDLNAFITVDEAGALAAAKTADADRAGGARSGRCHDASH